MMWHSRIVLKIVGQAGLWGEVFFLVLPADLFFSACDRNTVSHEHSLDLHEGPMGGWFSLDLGICGGRNFGQSSRVAISASECVCGLWVWHWQYKSAWWLGWRASSGPRN